MINFLLLTYDSCRYDVLVSARTPVLDSYSAIHRAEAPANFTFASHQAFFVGFLPNVKELSAQMLSSFPVINSATITVITKVNIGNTAFIAFSPEFATGFSAFNASSKDK